MDVKIFRADEKTVCAAEDAFRSAKGTLERKILQVDEARNLLKEVREWLAVGQFQPEVVAYMRRVALEQALSKDARKFVPLAIIDCKWGSGKTQSTWTEIVYNMVSRPNFAVLTPKCSRSFEEARERQFFYHNQYLTKTYSVPVQLAPEFDWEWLYNME